MCAAFAATQVEGSVALKLPDFNYTKYFAVIMKVHVENIFLDLPKEQTAFSMTFGASDG